VARTKRENAAEAEALPLLAYAGLVADHTAEEMYWRWRSSKARAAARRTAADRRARRR
jgi:hypothetical protein